MSGGGDSALNWYSRRLAHELASAAVSVSIVGPRATNGGVQMWNDGGIPVYPSFVRGSSRAIGQALVRIQELGAPIVHVQHELFAYGGLLNAILLPFALAYLRIRGYKIVTTIHGIMPLSEVSDEFVRANRMPGNAAVTRIVWRTLIRAVARCSDRIHVHETFLRDLLVKEYDTKTPVTVIPLGVETVSKAPERGEARRRFGLPAEAEVALFFGYLAAYKGIEYLLAELQRMLQRRPALHLVIAGSIPERLRGSLDPETVLTRLPVERDRVHFLGFVPDAAIPNLFAAADVLVLPYTIAMSSSGPLALAIGYGLPVLLSAAFQRSFPHAPTFFKLEPGALAESLDAFFDNEDGLRSRSCAFLSELRERRAWPNVVKALREVYETL